MTFTDRTASPGYRRSPTYRELWSTERGDQRVTVRVYLDGTEEFEDHPEIPPEQVRAQLKTGHFHFVRLLR